MASGRKLIINWLIKSKAIKDDERELYEYALYSIVNAQNLSVTGFPDLTKENEKKFA